MWRRQPKVSLEAGRGRFRPGQEGLVRDVDSHPESQEEPPQGLRKGATSFCTSIFVCLFVFFNVTSQYMGPADLHLDKSPDLLTFPSSG